MGSAIQCLAMYHKGDAASHLIAVVLVAALIAVCTALPIPASHVSDVREGAEPRLVMKQVGAAPFEWRMCGDDTDNIQITDAAAAPSPIKFSRSRELPIKIALTGSIAKEITGGSFDLELKKRVPYMDVWEKIPCIEDYGSCSYELCSSVEHIFGSDCDPWFERNGVSCHCPFTPVNISSSSSIFNLPASGNVPSWLVDGDLQAKITVYDQDKQRAVCFWLQFSILLAD